MNESYSTEQSNPLEEGEGISNEQDSSNGEGEKKETAEERKLTPSFKERRTGSAEHYTKKKVFSNSGETKHHREELIAEANSLIEKSDALQKELDEIGEATPENQSRLAELTKNIENISTYQEYVDAIKTLQQIEEELVSCQNEYNTYIEELKTLNGDLRAARSSLTKTYKEQKQKETEVAKYKKFAEKSDATESDKRAFRLVESALADVNKRISWKENVIQDNPKRIKDVEERMQELDESIDELEEHRIRKQLQTDSIKQRMQETGLIAVGSQTMSESAFSTVEIPPESTGAHIWRFTKKVPDKTRAFAAHPVGRFLLYPFVFTGGLVGTLWRSFKSYTKNSDKAFGGHDHLDGWKNGAGKSGAPDKK